jgi:hypothetical protein
MMGWPLSQDYNEAVQDPAASFGDADLKRGKAATNALGIPMPRSGNFADVYEVTTPRGEWAVKCFTRQIPALRERYKEVSAYLKKNPQPFMVEFTFLEQGIRVRGDWYPALKMNWVEGFTLNQYVKNNLERPQYFEILAHLWVKLAARLNKANMAHGDLQHGNVLLVPNVQTGGLVITLVDYDGMCVPALSTLKSIEVGHPNYQHPQRAREHIYGPEVDRFSHLVIYTALRALTTGGKELWAKYDNGDNLLFKASDFEKPTQSTLFAELLRFPEPGVQILAEQMVDALRKPLKDTPRLEDLDGLSLSSTPKPLRERTVVRSGPVPIAKPYVPARKRSWLRLALTGVVAAVILIGVALAGMVLLPDTEQPQSGAVAAKSDLEKKSHRAKSEPGKIPVEAKKEPDATEKAPPEAAAEPKPEPKPEKPDLKPDPKPAPEPEPTPEPEPDSKAEVKPDPKPEPKPDPKQAGEKDDKKSERPGKETDQIRNVTFAKPNWDFPYLEKTFGVKLKAVKAPEISEVGRGFTQIRYKVLVEFGKDLDKEEIESLSAAIFQQKLPAAADLVFLDADNVVLSRDRTFLMSQGDLTGTKGDAFWFILTITCGIPEDAKKAEFRRKPEGKTPDVEKDRRVPTKDR